MMTSRSDLTIRLGSGPQDPTLITWRGQTLQFKGLRGDSLTIPVYLPAEAQEIITELERRTIVEQIEQALVEIDDSEVYVSEKVVEGLKEALLILGVKPDESDD